MAINGRGSKSREMNGSELVVGRQPVLEALRQGTASCIYLLEGRRAGLLRRSRRLRRRPDPPFYGEAGSI